MTNGGCCTSKVLLSGRMKGEWHGDAGRGLSLQRHLSFGGEGADAWSGLPAFFSSIRNVLDAQLSMRKRLGNWVFLVGFIAAPNWGLNQEEGEMAWVGAPLFSMVDPVKLSYMNHWMRLSYHKDCVMWCRGVGMLCSTETIPRNSWSFLKVRNPVERIQKPEKVAFGTGINTSDWNEGREPRNQKSKGRDGKFRRGARWETWG